MLEREVKGLITAVFLLCVLDGDPLPVTMLQWAKKCFQNTRMVPVVLAVSVAALQVEILLCRLVPCRGAREGGILNNTAFERRMLKGWALFWLGNVTPTIFFADRRRSPQSNFGRVSGEEPSHCVYNIL